FSVWVDSVSCLPGSEKSKAQIHSSVCYPVFGWRDTLGRSHVASTRSVLFAVRGQFIDGRPNERLYRAPLGIQKRNCNEIYAELWACRTLSGKFGSHTAKSTNPGRIHYRNLWNTSDAQPAPEFRLSRVASAHSSVLLDSDEAGRTEVIFLSDPHSAAI